MSRQKPHLLPQRRCFPTTFIGQSHRPWIRRRAKRGRSLAARSLAALSLGGLYVPGEASPSCGWTTAIESRTIHLLSHPIKRFPISAALTVPGVSRPASRQILTEMSFFVTEQPTSLAESVTRMRPRPCAADHAKPRTCLVFLCEPHVASRCLWTRPTTSV